MTLEAQELTTLYIAALIAIIVGAILLSLSGIIYVKKGYTAIIEKLGVYYGTYHSGIYYFAPFVYRRVGLYKNSNSEFELIINKTIIRIKISIIDFQKYHYSTKSFSNIVDDLKSKDFAEVTQFINELQNELIKIGCSLVK